MGIARKSRQALARLHLAAVHADPPGDRLHQRRKPGDLVLGEQIYLQVEIGATVGGRGDAVLADQHEG